MVMLHPVSKILPVTEVKLTFVPLQEPQVRHSASPNLYCIVLYCILLTLSDVNSEIKERFPGKFDKKS